MKKIFIFILILQLQNCFTQSNYINYYNLVNEAEYQYYFGSIDTAIDLYQMAFRSNKPFNKDLYLLGISFCKKLDTSNCKKCLLDASKQSLLFPRAMSNLDSIVLYNSFTETQSIKRLWRLCQDNVDERIKIMKNEPEIQKLKDTLMYFEHIDQKFRSLNDNRKMLNIQDTSVKAIEYRKASYENDSLIQNQFLKYVSENGFPTIEFGDMFTTILMHFTSENYDRAKTILFNEVVDGHLDPFYYGMMVDRLEYLFNGNDCYYGIIRNDCHQQAWNGIINRRKEAGISMYFNSPNWRRYSVIKEPSLPWISNK